jgi:hypothetical protein
VLQDYTYSNWLYHVENGLGDPTDRVTHDGLSTLLRKFFSLRYTPVIPNAERSNRPRPNFQVLKDKWPDLWVAIQNILLFMDRKSDPLVCSGMS